MLPCAWSVMYMATAFALRFVVYIFILYKLKTIRVFGETCPFNLKDRIMLPEVGMAAHRGNLNYQDCRRTLTDGFEDDGVDYLRMVFRCRPALLCVVSLIWARVLIEWCRVLVFTSDLMRMMYFIACRFAGW